MPTARSRAIRPRSRFTSRAFIDHASDRTLASRTDALYDSRRAHPAVPASARAAPAVRDRETTSSEESPMSTSTHLTSGDAPISARLTTGDAPAPTHLSGGDAPAPSHPAGDDAPAPARPTGGGTP